MKSKRTHRLLLIASNILLFLLVSINVVCQNSTAHLEKPFGYNPNDFNTVFNMSYGADGNLYIAHENGVSQYNGYKTDLLPYNGSGKSCDNLILSTDSILWGITFAGEVFYLKNDRLVRHNISKKVQDYLPLIRKSEQATYLILSHDVFVIADTSIHHLFRSKVNISTVTNVFVSEEKNKDILYSSGFKVVIDLEKHTVGSIQEYAHPIDDSTRIHQKNAAFVFQDTIRFIGFKDQWVKDFVNNDFKDAIRFQRVRYYKNTKVTECKLIFDKYLAISGFNGLLIYDEKGNLVHEVLEGQVVSRVLPTKNGGLWVATIKNGFYFIPSMVFKNVQFSPSTSDIYKVFQLNDTIFSVSRMNGSFDLVNTKNHTHRRYSLAKTSEIQSMHMLNEKLYIYCDSLFIYDLEKERVVDDFFVTATKDIYKKGKSIYCGTSLGFFKIDEIHRNSRKLNFSYWVNDLEYESDSTILIGSKKGLFRFHFYNETIVPLVANNDFKSVRDVFKIKDIIIAHINGRHIIMYHHDTTKVLFSVRKEESVKRVQRYQDDVYLLTNQRVVKIDVRGRTQTLFYYDDYFPSLKIIDFTLFSKTIALFTNEGYVQVPLQMKPTQVDFQINFKDSPSSFTQQNDVYFSEYSSNYFSLQFEVAPSFLGKKRTKVFYRLRSSDTDWERLYDLDGKYILSLNQLKWGNHYLEIKVVKQGKEKLLQYHLQVNHPIWLQWWFILLIVLGIGLLIYMIIKWRVRIVKKKAEKDLMAQKLKNRALSAELTAIRTQMQPHFIYNVLTSIQAKILKGDKNNAYNSTRAFANLMRSVLDNSKDEFVLLQDEITFLKNYIALEKDRLDDEVEVIFDIDSRIDLQKTKIPNLLFQPIVENAFKHGLRHKKGAKKLAVTIEKENASIWISIRDNGIGRLKSAEINNQQKKYHNSFATEAIQDRIERINEFKKGVEIKMDIIDLDEGTEVKIELIYGE